MIFMAGKESKTRNCFGVYYLVENPEKEPIFLCSLWLTIIFLIMCIFTGHILLWALWVITALIVLPIVAWSMKYDKLHKPEKEVIMRKEVQTLLGASRILKKMVNKGQIVRLGGSRTVRYMLA